MAKEKFDRFKPYCNIGIIGHVDYGKIILMVVIICVLVDVGLVDF
jgi:elongation factor Tu